MAIFTAASQANLPKGHVATNKGRWLVSRGGFGPGMFAPIVVELAHTMAPVAERQAERLMNRRRSIGISDSIIEGWDKRHVKRRGPQTIACATRPDFWQLG